MLLVAKLTELSLFSKYKNKCKDLSLIISGLSEDTGHLIRGSG